MEITPSNLNMLFRGFNAAFRTGAAAREASSLYMRIAEVIPSGSDEEVYGWLGKIPGMKRWEGERVVERLRLHDYKLANEDFEDTIQVDRNRIEDDRYGVYGPLFRRLGAAVAAHPDEMVWPKLKAGFSETCYDGQYFFDTDHPVLDADGGETSVSNDGGGSGTAWFLAQLGGVMKPMIFQRRKSADNIVRKDRDEDDNVFFERQLIYGAHCRDVTGFGEWQCIWGSKQTLNAANYNAGREALIGMKGDYGRPLGVMPDTLIVPPALEQEAREIVINERAADGATNTWRGTAELLVVPWLA